MHATGRRLGAAARTLGSAETGNGRAGTRSTAAAVQDREMIRLVVTDLDGTLWRRGRRSGRADAGSDPGTGAPRDPTSRRHRPPFMVGGALPAHRPNWTSPWCSSTVRSAGTREVSQPFTSAPSSPVDALDVLDVFERHGVMPGANFETREWDVVSGPVPSSGEPYVAWAGSHLRLVDDLRAMVAALPVYAFSVVACPEATALRAVRDELAAASGVGMVNVFPDKVFGGWTLDSAPKGVNKWSGVEAYCRYRGLDPGAVLAIGDGDNDVELFERAVHACAMSHATDRAKAAAHVTFSDGMDGWAQLLNYL